MSHVHKVQKEAKTALMLFETEYGYPWWKSGWKRSLDRSSLHTGSV